MTPDQALDVAWVLVSAALVMFMQAGFSSLESGLVRTKNSINVAAKNFADFCLTSSVYWLFGFALMFGATKAGWFGASGFGFADTSDPRAMAFFVFQVGFAGTAVTIMSGAVAERMRFSGYLVAALIMSAIVYPIFGHWVWAGSGGGGSGWLEDLGFIDFAGSTVVHSVGGWLALAAVLVIGPRLGRFGRDAVPIRGHDLPIVTVGVFILWFGWFGFNGGSTLAFTSEVPAIIANTSLSAAFGGLAALAISWLLEGRPDVPTIMNGALAGLVGITAAANIVTPRSAAVIGIIAGVVMYGATVLMERRQVDDAVGAVPVHLAAGVWGTLAVALFGDVAAWEGGSRLGQLGVQAVGVIAAFVWAFGLGYLLLRLINVWFPLRIDPDGERIGLNVSEHGASTEILDLLTEMDKQRVANDYSQPVNVEPHTEIGQIAAQYNRVLAEINRQTTALDLVRKTASAANEAATIEAAFRTAVDEICVTTGWPVGHVYLVDETRPRELRSTNIWYLSDSARFAGFVASTEQTPFRLGSGLPGDVLAAKEPKWFSVARAGQGHPRRDAAADAALRSGFAFPVMVGTEVAAVLEFFTEEALEPDGRLLAVMAAVGTQLGRTVERTRSAEQRVQTVVDNMPAMVLLRDLDGRFVLVNREYEAFYQVTRDQVRGRTLPEIGSLSDDGVDYEIGRNVQQDRAVIDSGGVIEEELTILRDGRQHTLASVKFPIPDHAGLTVGVGGIELDITDRKRQEAELAELVRSVEMARDQAMEATAAKSRFLANMSHELRTPLNAILGFTRIVRRRSEALLPEQSLDNLDKILISGENLVALVNDILDLSRIEAGRQEVNPGEVDLGALIDQCLATVEPLVSSPGVRLGNDVDDDVPILVTDEDKVRQILMNLLSNAVKFTQAGSVQVRVEGLGQRVAIEVADTGVGIDEAALELIFEEFHQEAPTAGTHAGTGLGLTISRQLARLLGGDITVESTSGVGSTFRLELPIRYEPPRASAA